MVEPILEPLLRQIRFNKVLNQITKNSTVIDIGCGHTAHFLNRLERYLKSGIGIDPLIKNSKIGKIHLISHFLSNKIPVKSNSADFVTLIAVLEHLENHNAILLESYRILKPGGKIVITTPTPANKPLLEFLAFKIGIVSKREIAEHKTYFWKGELVKGLEESGYKNIKHEYFELWLNNFVIAEK